MARPPQQLDASLLDGPFHIGAGRAVGTTRGRMRGSDLLTPIRGIRIRRDDDGFEARLHAYALHRGHDFAFSHTTAARIYGIPLPGYPAPEIHVSVPDPGRAPVIRGFVGHKLRRWDTRIVAGVPVTTPEQTWIDLAGMLSPTALVIAGDFLIAGRASLTSRAALRAQISASTGRRGIARARAAITSLRAGSESPGETRLRLLLDRAGLPEPVLNVDLFDEAGEFVARVDLAYPEARIALEYEGDVHRIDRSTWMKDIGRREHVEDLGWRMVRITADDLHHPDALVARIHRLLRTR